MFQGPGAHAGTLKKFELMLHGTREAPYNLIEPIVGQTNKKLDTVQKAHKRSH